MQKKKRTFLGEETTANTTEGALLALKAPDPRLTFGHGCPARLGSARFRPASRRCPRTARVAAHDHRVASTKGGRAYSPRAREAALDHRAEPRAYMRSLHFRFPGYRLALLKERLSTFLSLWGHTLLAAPLLAFFFFSFPAFSPQNQK